MHGLASQFNIKLNDILSDVEICENTLAGFWLFIKLTFCCFCDFFGGNICINHVIFLSCHCLEVTFPVFFVAISDKEVKSSNIDLSMRLLVPFGYLQFVSAYFDIFFYVLFRVNQYKPTRCFQL